MGWILVVAIIFSGMGLRRTALVEELETLTIDALFNLRGERPLDPSITLIKIDEPTLQELGWPLSRDLFTGLVVGAARNGARGLGFTFPFRYGSLSQSDRRLANEIKSFGRVALVGEYQATLDSRGGRWLGVESVRPPVPILRESAGRLAHNVLGKGYASGYRRQPLVLQHDEPVFSLSLAMLALEEGEAAISEQSERLTVEFADSRRQFEAVVDRKGFTALNYRTIRPQQRLFSLSEVLRRYARELASGGTASAYLREVFAGQWVLIGYADTTTLGEFESTPFGTSRPLFAHANALDNVLNNRFLKRLPAWQIDLLSLLLGLFCGGAVLARKVRAGIWAIAVIILGWSVAALGTLALADLHLDLLIPVTSFAVIFVTGMSHRFFVVEREIRLLQNLFARYVAPEVLAEVLRDPDAASLQPAGREVTLLFADIQGYTRWSNEVGAEGLVGILRAYLARMTDIVFANGGTIGTFMGDGIFAIFGAPIDHRSHALNAIRCAESMHEALEQLNRQWGGEGKRTLSIRVGVATGNAYVGNFGSRGHVEYSALGPVVQLAARLESRAGSNRTLISEATYHAIRNEFACAFVDTMPWMGDGVFESTFELSQEASAPPGQALLPELRQQERGAVQLRVRLVWESGSLEAYTNDVSQRGLFVVSGGGPAVGTEVTLTLWVPAGSLRIPLHLTGIVRHRGESKHGRTGFGVEMNSDFSVKALSSENERPQ